jgi:LuxR family transcriptional regulator, maltose regulon positive regulatory protein
VSSLAPRLPAHHVPRPRLDELIATDDACLTLVVGPPGSGKSVLVREWLERNGRRWGWVALEDSHDAPVPFWHAVLAGLAAIDESIGVEARDRLAETGVTRHLLEGLVADLEAAAGRRAVLVLDDFHVIEDPAVLEGVRWLVDHRPPSLMIVVTSRVDPNLPLGRWRARGQLAEVRDEDLRFAGDEADALVTGFGVPGLDEASRTMLAERTEGWAAGLQLAALALRRSPDPAGFVQRFDGTERTVAEFLLQEVVDRQPPDVRAFLLDTSVLATLSGPLCDAVTGGDRGAATLARLEAAHLFVVRLDRPGHWYRYHQLFADFLRYRLRMEHPARLPELHRRAAAWFAEEGEADRAIAHARSAADPGLQLDLIARFATPLYAQGRSELALQALADIPDAFIEEDLHRSTQYAFVLGICGLLTECLSWLDRLEPRLGEDDDDLRAVIAVGRASAEANRGAAGAFFAGYRPRSHAAVGPYPQVAAYARLWALRMLTLTDRLDEGLAATSRALALAEVAPGVGVGVVHSATAENLAVAGRLHDALSEAESSLASWRRLGGPADPGSCDALRARAMVHLEAGQLDEAERLVEVGLPYAEGIGVVYQIGMCEILLAEIARARGLPEEAVDRLEGSRRPVRGRTPGPELVSRIAEAMVRALLDAGDAARAEQVASEVTCEPARTLVAARVALAQGDPAGARRHLAHVAPTTPRRQVEAELLRARVARATRGDARVHVERALDLRQGEELAMTFHQERDLAPLYTEPAVARRLPAQSTMSAMSGEGRATVPLRAVGLVDQLTERELDLLRLLPTHLSNREMAAELFVSVNTVKTHLKSLYRKLGAVSRSEAVARGRSLLLLP